MELVFHRASPHSGRWLVAPGNRRGLSDFQGHRRCEYATHGWRYPRIALARSGRGGLRELHWHQNADEWQYFIQGKARQTVFFNGSKARTADFNAGDVGYVPKTFGHYIENTGDTDLVFLEMFKSNRFQDLSLSDWVTHTPPELIQQHLGLSMETLRAIPKNKLAVVPG